MRCGCLHLLQNLCIMRVPPEFNHNPGAKGEDHEFTVIFHLIYWKFKFLKSKWNKNKLCCFVTFQQKHAHAQSRVLKRQIFFQEEIFKRDGWRLGGEGIPKRGNIMSNKQKCETLSFLFCWFCFLRFLLGEEIGKKSTRTWICR